MLKPDRIVVRLDELLNTLEDPKAAYVVRSRLDRVAIMIRRYIAEVQEADSELASRLDEALTRIEDAFRALRRRSEPFGEAWVQKLASTRAELVLLRAGFSS